VKEEDMAESHARLDMVWEALRRLCEEAGEIGLYPAADDRLLGLAEEDVKEALHAWAAYDHGALEALQSMDLSRVLDVMGEVVGERFELDSTRAMHFGQWLAQAVTGWPSDTSDDDEIDMLNALAGQAVHGRNTAIGFAWTHADWWMRYQRAIPPMMARLEGGST
jgi:hypothetical protein